MSKINFVNGRVEDYTIVLSTRDYRHLGQLYGLKDVTYNAHMNSADEMSFTVYKNDLVKTDNKTYDERIEKYREYLWENIVNFKLIWVKELDEYFEIQVSLDDSNDVYKSITATSLCEAELGQTILYNIEINTEDDIARDNYNVTTFYNVDDPKASLLHRILDCVPHYTIKHVDKSLCKIQRMFSIDGTAVYDFLIGECSEQFTCLFQFDSTDRSISVYDLMTVCEDCGERGEYKDICPECGSTNLKYYGEDTTIYVDKNNLTDSIHFETNVDSVKNCFKLEAGDDVITYAVRSLNQNGSDRIYINTEEQKKDMPEELVKRLDEYDKLYDSYTVEYENLLREWYDLIDDRSYYTSSMMPTIEHSEVTAQTEADKLTVMNLSPVGLSSVTEYTSIATINNAIKNYAKVYVKTGYVKIEIAKNDNNQEDATFSYIGQDSDGYNYGTWYGRLKVTNYSDTEDIAYTNYMSIKVYDNFEDFMTQKVAKNIKSDEDDENSVFDVLAIEELEDFKEALALYCLNRLKSFRDAIEGALDVLKSENQGNEDAELYDALYLPYYNKFKACEEEMNVRQAKIDDIQYEIDKREERMTEIQSDLNFEEYLGDLYSIFCSYKREDKYSNSNYISDGLSNTEIIDRAKEFLDTAKKELVKSSEQQCTLSSTLNNLLVIDDFKDIVNHFELGNWIRVRADGTLYRLRLIGYEINFSSLQTINVEFSTLTKIDDMMSDAQSVIKSAQSMAKSYGAFVKQAEKGKIAQDSINEWVKEGLNSALITIKNNDTEDIQITKNGILGRSYDDIIEDYSDKQFIVTHNIMAFTDNNWKSCVQAIGEHNYTYYNEEKNEYVQATGYGMTAQFVQAGYINGSQVIGGDIYSDNYNYNDGTGTHINLREGKMNLGNKLVFDGTNLKVIGNISGSTIESTHMSSGSISIGSNFNVDTSGNLVANNATLNNVTANSGSFTGKVTATSGSFTGEITANTGKIGGWTIGTSSLTGGNVTLNGSGDITGSGWSITNGGKASFNNISVTGGSISIGSNFNVNTSGNMTASNVSLTGTITATGGTIGGCKISSGSLTVPASHLSNATVDGKSVEWQGVNYVYDVVANYGHEDYPSLVSSISIKTKYLYVLCYTGTQV